MSYLDLFTWGAIGVLILGSSAVFLWFLRDVRRLFRGGASRSLPGAQGAPRAEKGDVP